jgi:NDP-sugar pyrophosphorylase family protein
MKRAIIQAGGKGTRLYPYTAVLPKPMMPIGDFPILEIVLRQLVHHGFHDITITVGHLGHLIMAVLGDGSRFGARVQYLREEQPRGTMGGLSRFRDLDEPLLVMNGDLLTDFNFRSFMRAHLEGDASLSVGVYYKQIPVSLGVLELDDTHRAIGFREKPVLSFPCSMGIYAVSPDLIPLIPSKGLFGFDDLMALCLDENIPVQARRFDGLWLDIGRPEDYASATQLFQEHKARLFPPPHRPLSPPVVGDERLSEAAAYAVVN